jgi:hypothetical protein
MCCKLRRLSLLPPPSPPPCVATTRIKMTSTISGQNKTDWRFADSRVPNTPNYLSCDDDEMLTQQGRIWTVMMKGSRSKRTKVWFANRTTFVEVLGRVGLRRSLGRQPAACQLNRNTVQIIQ